MNMKAYDFCENHNVSITAGSDAHFLMEIGRGCLLLEHADSVEEIRHQIMSNKVSVIRIANFIPIVNLESLFFHAFTGISRFFWPVRQYFGTNDVPKSLIKFSVPNRKI